MAHELEIVNGKAQLFYAGELPWHGLGTGVPEAISSEEAIVLGGLNWGVKVGPLFGPDHKGISDYYSIYRETDKKVLGISRGGYTPLQNIEAFDFLDSLLQDGVLRYETAGSLFGGRRVFLLARMNEDMRVGDDNYHDYLLLTNQHDCLGKLRIFPTKVRVVCNNTLQVSLRGANRGIALTHSLSLHTKMAQAKEVLRITTAASRRMNEWLASLQDKQVDAETIETVQKAVVGSYDDTPSAQKRKAIETFQAIYAAEKALAGADTAYALVNAVTGTVDHTRRYTGDSAKRAESRFQSLTMGGGADSKDAALLLISHLTNTPALEA